MENKLIKVTPSQIGILLECPQCLWLYFNKGLRQPMGPFPSLPGAMDTLFKNYFDEFREKNMLPPELEGKATERLFPDIEKLKIWRNNMQGIRASFPEYGIFLKGAIDELLVAQTGEVVILDFKTRGYATKEDSHIYYHHQLNLYALLFEKNNYQVAPYAYLLFFWPNKYDHTGSSFESDLVKINVSPDDARKTLQGVADIINGSMPMAVPQCQFCRYRNFRSNE